MSQIQEQTLGPINQWSENKLYVNNIRINAIELIAAPTMVLAKSLPYRLLLLHQNLLARIKAFLLRQ